MQRYPDLALGAMKNPLYLNTRGVAMKFRMRGRTQVSQNQLSPNSDLSSDFAHFILKILENLKILASIQKIFIENRDLWGDVPQNF